MIVPITEAIPDALTNGCGKCTDKQKSGTDKVVKFLRANKQADWERLQAKWDPQGVFVAKYADKLTR
ncbi:Ejaculatory bulb-specific protein 3 [Gryllus bimaculatus]|nr:Ejaculatory bulb-specific protein 3 [Gryllus bimaculatus]